MVSGHCAAELLRISRHFIPPGNPTQSFPDMSFWYSMPLISHFPGCAFSKALLTCGPTVKPNAPNSKVPLAKSNVYGLQAACLTSIRDLLEGGGIGGCGTFSFVSHWSMHLVPVAEPPDNFGPDSI